LLFFASLLFSKPYPSFTKDELANIAKSNIISKNRIEDYQKTMFLHKNDSKELQLKRMNLYLNTLLPQYDDVVNKKIDSWATPKEFLTVGYGDCEDYVIIKYYSLIRLGFDEKKLFITRVKEKYRGGLHMVLTYFKEKNQPPLVLDNLSFKILDLKTRSDIEAEVFINSTGVYKATSDFKLIKIAKKYKEFEELKAKVKKNH
ncbi:MAG: transglutaminase-like cysteine peptidase, partial [Campylobacterota bacterium]|nr:transglutaminase-like cysteine peptidase [Campylobacterota bacterium]